MLHFHQLTQDREDSVRLLNKPSMRGIRASIVEKYTEKAHFVYELLQNADDVAATAVRFILRKDGLYFLHNGTAHFTVTALNDTENIGHINAITAIGDTTKSGDTPKIGKFGIGFKAVFQYTNHPHIYDPHISFKIKDLIVPVLLPHEPHPFREKGETLFYLPFDRIEKSSTEAIEEIEDKLQHLAFPLLFLRHLKSIVWESDNGIKGNYALKNDEISEFHLQKTDKKIVRQRFLRFSRPVATHQTVQIILSIDENGQPQQVKKCPAYCFFPTKVLTGLKFWVHAPFLLNDSREGIRQKESWNEQLIQQLAALLLESVEKMTNAPHFDPEKLLVTLPLEKEDLDTLFAPMATILWQYLYQVPLLPALNGEKVAIANAYLAEHADLHVLYATPQLTQLFGEGARWVFPDLTSNAKFWQVAKMYLTANKAATTAEYLVKQANADFWRVQTTDWLVQFCCYAAAQHRAWWFTEHGLIRHLPILRTKNGQMASIDQLIKDKYSEIDIVFWENTVVALWLEALKITKNASKFTQNPEKSPKQHVLQPQIKVIYDTLTEEERLALMQSVEPQATYAIWEEVQDFEIEGLGSFLSNETMTMENSIFLWNFLTQCMDNQIINEANIQGKYVFIWQDENIIPFKAYYWKELSNAVWLYDKTENRHAPADFTDISMLHAAYSIHPTLISYLFSIETPPIDRFAHLTDEEKAAIAIGTRFLAQGYSTDDLLELRRIKAHKALQNKENIDKSDKKIKKKAQKREKIPDSEDNELTSSEALLKKQQALRAEMEEELEEKIEQLVEIEGLKEKVQASEKYSFAWFKALLRLEYLLAYERQDKDKSLKIHFEKVEREEGTNKTILLKRPSRAFPANIEDANDISLKVQLEKERRNIAIEVVSIKDGYLRAKLTSPEEIQDLDFYKIRSATLEIQNTIFVLEELSQAFFELPFEETDNLQQFLPPTIRFIFGPPGTGKTTYLAHEEIQPFMLGEQELKILVLTPTNKAADVLVKKVQQFCGESPDWLIRFGTTSEMSIENAGLLRDAAHDIHGQSHFCVVTTITRFPYDGFNEGAFDYKFKNIAWDIIIIDEASMIGVAYITYTLLQQKQAQFIIGGDPFQIAPVVFSEDWKGENIYTMVHLDTFDPVLQKERLLPHAYPIINLITQYRSLNTIGQLYSHFAYESILRHKRHKAHKKPMDLPNLPLKDINIIQFPVQNTELIFKPQLLNNSHYHLYSALLTVELLRYIAQKLHEQENKEKWRLGIICPYKAQATLVDKILNSLHLNYPNIHIQTGTIHSFQGDECDMVLCLFNPPQYISKNPNAFLNQKNILNVAISRAKDCLILLMPDENTPNFDNLYQIRRLQGIIQYYLAGVCQHWSARAIEEIIFQQGDFLYENTFTTMHQSVNVYTKPEKKYEIRIEDTAVDVQVTN